MNFGTLLSVALHYMRPRTQGLGRDPRWRTACKRYLVQHPKCVCCGQDAKTVHHVKPVHVAPELEMVPENWAAVCDKCHFSCGHGNNWKKWNELFWQTVDTLNRGRRP